MSVPGLGINWYNIFKIAAAQHVSTWPDRKGLSPKDCIWARVGSPNLSHLRYCWLDFMKKQENKKELEPAS